METAVMTFVLGLLIGTVYSAILATIVIRRQSKGDPAVILCGKRGCNQPAVAKEVGTQSGKIYKYLCNRHLTSFNPYTQFVSLERKESA